MNEKVIEELNRAVLMYAAFGKRAAAEVLVEKGKQLVFGAHNKYADFPGLFEEFSAIKPFSGRITLEAKFRFRGGGGLKISHSSYKKADAVLGANPSGVFALSANTPQESLKPPCPCSATRGC